MRNSWNFKQTKNSLLHFLKLQWNPCGSITADADMERTFLASKPPSQHGLSKSSKTKVKVSQANSGKPPAPTTATPPKTAGLKSILKNRGSGSKSTAGKSILRSDKKAANKVVIPKTKTSSQSVLEGDNGELLKSNKLAVDEKKLELDAASKTSNASIDTIEQTLYKSAGVLSKFTEHTILVAGVENGHLMADRIGTHNITTVSQKKKRMWSANANDQRFSARRKADMSKLPTSIVQLLRGDSSSSVSPKDKTRAYHSNKMALKQSHDPSGSAPLGLRSSSQVPKIVVISTPLQLEKQTDGRGNSSLQATTTSGKMNVAGKSSANTRVDRKIGFGGPHITSVKKTQKTDIGVEKGAAFILGPKGKGKHPYLNTLGIAKNLRRDLKAVNRKWVMDIGNFQDSEITFVLADNKLKITGFRAPNLNFPDGQSASEDLRMPPNLDINNLRIYRSDDAREILIVEEIQRA